MCGLPSAIHTQTSLLPIALCYCVHLLGDTHTINAGLQPSVMHLEVDVTSHWEELLLFVYFITIVLRYFIPFSHHQHLPLCLVDFFCHDEF